MSEFQYARKHHFESIGYTLDKTINTAQLTIHMYMYTYMYQKNVQVCGQSTQEINKYWYSHKNPTKSEHTCTSSQSLIVLGAELREVPNHVNVSTVSTGMNF